MNTRSPLALLFLLVCGFAHAQEPKITPAPPEIKITSKVKGGVVVLSAETMGKGVWWLPDAGMSLFLPADALKDPRTSIWQCEPGRRRVVAATILADQVVFAEHSFDVGGQPTPVPPPAPPAPVPPTDDLPKRLADAYAAEPSPYKRGQLIHLVGIYQSIAKHAETDTDIATTRKLIEVLGKVKEGLLQDNVLRDMRSILAAETRAALGPPSDAPLDRERAVAHFTRVLRSLPPTE